VPGQQHPNTNQSLLSAKATLSLAETVQSSGDSTPNTDGCITNSEFARFSQILRFWILDFPIDQEEVFEDAYPIKLLAGVDIVLFLRELKLVRSGQINEEWLAALSNPGPPPSGAGKVNLRVNRLAPQGKLRRRNRISLHRAS
jgi:hypothetical protein